MKPWIAAASWVLCALAPWPAAAQAPAEGLVVRQTACIEMDGKDFCPYAKSASATEGFLHVQVSLGALGERVVLDPDIDAATVSVIQNQANELQGLFSGKSGGPADQIYVEALDDMATALLFAARSPDAAAANGMLGMVRDDLATKLETARSRLGATTRTPKPIRVTARTMKDTTLVTGYVIACLPAYYAGRKPTIYFNAPTGPTSASLSPGWYEFVVFKNGVETYRKFHRVVTEADAAFVFQVSR